jgi:hypothetical protein
MHAVLFAEYVWHLAIDLNGQAYGHPIYFLETFVDPERFRGTCYRAANWVVMGGRRDAASSPTATFRTGRSKRFWATH